MRFLVIERFRGGDPRPVYARFAARGRLAPEGLTYVASWVTEDLARCFQVMECDDRALLDRWMEAWRDLVDFEVLPVLDSPAAAAAVAALAEAPPAPAVHALDHVQLAIPPGGEEAARGFYVGVLGMREVPKPAALAGRGGVWLEGGAARVHLGAEAEFRPARKAHPALRVDGLDALLARCEAAGVAVQRDVPLDGCRRAHVSDPFGNRVELVEREEPA